MAEEKCLSKIEAKNIFFDVEEKKHLNISLGGLGRTQMYCFENVKNISTKIEKKKNNVRDVINEIYLGRQNFMPRQNK